MKMNILLFLQVDYYIKSQFHLLNKSLEEFFSTFIILRKDNVMFDAYQKCPYDKINDSLLIFFNKCIICGTKDVMNNDLSHKIENFINIPIKIITLMIFHIFYVTQFITIILKLKEILRYLI